MCVFIYRAVYIIHIPNCVYVLYIYILNDLIIWYKLLEKYPGAGPLSVARFRLEATL